MKPDAYAHRYENSGFVTEISRGPDGNELLCERCGFVYLKVDLGRGFTMQTCSSLPIVKLEDPAFQKWLTRLADDTLKLNALEHADSKHDGRHNAHSGDDCIVGKAGGG